MPRGAVRHCWTHEENSELLLCYYESQPDVRGSYNAEVCSPQHLQNIETLFVLVL